MKILSNFLYLFHHQESQEAMIYVANENQTRVEMFSLQFTQNSTKVQIFFN